MISLSFLYREIEGISETDQLSEQSEGDFEMEGEDPFAEGIDAQPEPAAPVEKKKHHKSRNPSTTEEIAGGDGEKKSHKKKKSKSVQVDGDDDDTAESTDEKKSHKKSSAEIDLYKKRLEELEAKVEELSKVHELTHYIFITIFTISIHCLGRNRGI